MLVVHHARKIVGELGGLFPVLRQMQFQPFLTVGDGARHTSRCPQLCVAG